MTREFVKHSTRVPAGYFAWEAAGLHWLRLAEQGGGARTVEVLRVEPDGLVLERLHETAPTRSAAEELGRALARTHLAGAAAYGAGPEGWDGDGFFGPLAEPLPLATGTWPTWGAFYAEARIAPLARLARERGVYDADQAATFEALCHRLADGAFDTDDPPARLHGDLWSGNVMWTRGGAVLVDPAAHGGHRENDLALLQLFGAPHLESVLGGYQDVRPLADGWRDRVGLHQLHCLLVHAVIYGGGYADRAIRIARGPG